MSKLKEKQGKVDLGFKNLDYLIWFLGKRREILTKDWESGKELIDNSRLGLISGKTPALVKFLQSAWDDKRKVTEKSRKLAKAFVGILKGDSEKIEFDCSGRESESQRLNNEKKKLFEECASGKIRNGEVKVGRVLKSVYKPDKYLRISTKGARRWDDAEMAGEYSESFWMWLVVKGSWNDAGMGSLRVALSENCQDNAIDSGLGDLVWSWGEKLTVQKLCKELIKP